MQWTYEKILNILRSKGHRLTTTRTEILVVLIEKQHLSLNGIIRELHKKGVGKVNVTTVYNTLDLLLKEGILYLNVFNGRDIIFELSQPLLLHLVCENCRRIVHINNDDNKSDENNFFGNDSKVITEKLDNILLGANFKPVHYKFEAHGICSNCETNKNLNGK